MRVPLLWLNEYCNSGLSAEELAERLALTGTEVERIEHHGVRRVDAFVIGKVLEAEQHPDADRLRVCRVDIGNGAPAQIVCGAPNVAAGQTVAVARPGAEMPDGTVLKEVKLRGIASAGMILAEDEVELGQDHKGIMVLSDHLQPGDPLGNVFDLGSPVLVLEITPNRPDCLSIYGVAREVHAATGSDLAPEPWREDLGSRGEVAGFSVSVEATDLCPRFTARLFENITIAPSPLWLKSRLMAAGQRPINNVVDITNYVMLLTGQPLHAFDADKIVGGRLIVRRTADGEKLTTLDDAERTLDPDICIICDDQGPSSIAGIMGGQRSEVSPQTTRVLLESAVWNGPNIQRSSTKLGLRSEASSRYEKGLEPEGAMAAQALATKLLIELAGAAVAPGTIDVGAAPPHLNVLDLRMRRICALLGVEISITDATAILERLDLSVTATANADVLAISVPAFRRNDITREVDLIEEIARIWGLEKLPATLPPRHGVTGRIERKQFVQRQAEGALRGAGCDEIVGWSFAPHNIAEQLNLASDDPRAAVIGLENPLSEDQGVMRTMLLGSLLENARRNRSRGNHDLRLFEFGAVYRGPGGHEGPVALEHNHVGALITGKLRPPSWNDSQPPVADFFAAKGVLCALLDSLRVEWTVTPAREPFLHPGRAATVLVGGDQAPAGWIGELHPHLAERWDIDAATVFEVDFDVVTEHANLVPVYKPLSAFPPVRQDIAIMVDNAVSATALDAAIRNAAGSLLTAVEVFDVYHGDQVATSQKSVALRLTFQAHDRTLTEAEVTQLRDAVVGALTDQLGATLRT